MATIILWAIGVPLVIALVALPLLSFIKLEIKIWDVWRDIPREVYTSHRQQLFGLRPIRIWIASVVLSQISDVFKWLGWVRAGGIVAGASFAILILVLVYQLFWAARIIRSRAHLDIRLVRFAKYALCGYAACLLVLVAGLVENLAGK